MYPGAYPGAGYTPGSYPPTSTYPPGSYPPPPASSYPHSGPQPGVAYAPPSAPYPHYEPQPGVAYAPPVCPPSYSPPCYKPSYPGSSVPTTAGATRGYYWIDWDANRMVPPTAVRGGVDRDGCAIYVGRAYHAGDWIPAKVIPERHVAYVAHAGQEHSKSVFQVLLCEQRFDWVPTSEGNIPPGAVEGGRISSGEPLFVGRVWHDGAHTVGKVHASHNCCYIPYGGRELSFPSYEILVLRM